MNPFISSSSTLSISVSAASPNSVFTLSSQWLAQPIALHTLDVRANLIQRTQNPSDDCYLPDYALAGSAQEQNEMEEVAAHCIHRDSSSYYARARPAPEKKNDPKILKLFLPNVQTGRGLVNWLHSEPVSCRFHRLLQDAFQLGSGTAGAPTERAWALQARSAATMLLDVAMHEASLLAWYHKWHNPRLAVAQRLRPFETNANIVPLARSNSPSYPSQHTAIAGAAAEVLAQLFPRLQTELDELAQAVGLARVFAGVNYRSDHAAGLRLGKCVAHAVVQHFAK